MYRSDSQGGPGEGDVKTEVSKGKMKKCWSGKVQVKVGDVDNEGVTLLVYIQFTHIYTYKNNVQGELYATPPPPPRSTSRYMYRFLFIYMYFF